MIVGCDISSNLLSISSTLALMKLRGCYIRPAISDHPSTSSYIDKHPVYGQFISIYICICICIYIYTNSASCGAVDVRHVYRALHGTWLWGVIYIYLYMPRNLYTPRNGTLYVGLKSVPNPIIIGGLELRYLSGGFFAPPPYDLGT